MTTSPRWRREVRRGAADALHRPDPPNAPGPVVVEMLVDRAALVLGSSQPDDVVDAEAAAAAGLAVVRRRSGGGAVLLVPGEHVWLDVWLPVGDPRWLDDVGRAADWLADVWVEALAAVGVEGAVPHRGPMEPGEWGARVCFAGLGPGEVTVDGRKAVGVSQRRTREWARFQCLVHRRWNAAATFGVLTPTGGDDAAVAWQDRVVGIGDAPVADALFDALG